MGVSLWNPMSMIDHSPVVRVALELDGEECVLHRAGDGWIHPRPFGQEIWGLLRQGHPFREDAHEIVDYWAQVTVDMLNAGDVDGSDLAHLQTIRDAVQRSGYWFGLDGAWKVRREMQLVKPRDRLLFVTAYVRCGQYLLEATNAGTIRAPKRLGVVNCKLEICSDWWMDGKIANGDWFLSVEDEDSYHMGVDGLMPGRFVDLEIAGQTLLASPPRCEEGGVAAYWVAAYLLGSSAIHPWSKKVSQTFLDGYKIGDFALPELCEDLEKMLNSPERGLYVNGNEDSHVSVRSWDQERIRRTLAELDRIRHIAAPTDAVESPLLGSDA